MHVDDSVVAEAKQAGKERQGGVPEALRQLLIQEADRKRAPERLLDKLITLEKALEKLHRLRCLYNGQGVRFTCVRQRCVGVYSSRAGADTAAPPGNDAADHARKGLKRGSRRTATCDPGIGADRAQPEHKVIKLWRRLSSFNVASQTVFKGTTCFDQFCHRVESVLGHRAEKGALVVEVAVDRSHCAMQ